MSKHITEWLSAYADGELRGNRLHQVESHLVECEVCQAELESLGKLSDLLHEVPAAEFTSAERFAAQVNLRLHHQRTSTPRNKILELGWWMIPVGLLATWVFFSTAFLMSDLLSTANNFGLLTNLSNWPLLGSADQAYWSATLGQVGVLSGNSLDWAAATEAFTRTTLPQISLQISIALLYLSWIAIWWARRRRWVHGQVLEG